MLIRSLTTAVLAASVMFAGAACAANGHMPDRPGADDGGAGVASTKGRAERRCSWGRVRSGWSTTWMTGR